MTVPYQTKSVKNTVRNILGIQPPLSEIMANVGANVGSLTLQKIQKEVPTLDAYDWLNEPKPSDEVTRLKYENEALQREVDHQKQTLVNYQNNVSLYTDDYKRLEIDYKNSVRENRELQEEIRKFEDTERLNVILMKQIIELKKQLEEKE